MQTWLIDTQSNFVLNDLRESIFMFELSTCGGGGGGGDVCGCVGWGWG